MFYLLSYKAGWHGPDVTPGPNSGLYKIMINFLQIFSTALFLRMEYRLQIFFENKLINSFFHWLQMMVRHPDHATVLHILLDHLPNIDMAKI